ICRVNWSNRRSRRIMVPPFSLRLSESVFRFFCYHTTFWHADVNGGWFRPAARPENDLRAPQLPQPLLPALPVLSLTVPLLAPHQVSRRAPEEVDPLADAGGFAAGAAADDRVAVNARVLAVVEQEVGRAGERGDRNQPLAVTGPGQDVLALDARAGAGQLHVLRSHVPPLVPEALAKAVPDFDLPPQPHVGREERPQAVLVGEIRGEHAHEAGLDGQPAATVRRLVDDVHVIRTPFDGDVDVLDLGDRRAQFRPGEVFVEADVT